MPNLPPIRKLLGLDVAQPALDRATLPSLALMTWQLVLAVAAALFGGFIIWQNRPSLGPRRVGKARRDALVAARTKIESATSPAERAEALCNAGDSSALSTLSPTSAAGYYLRAMRADPTSSLPIVRAARGLGRRPRALESLLWRRLGGKRWEGAHRDAAIAALLELVRLYEGPLKNRSKAAAIGNALAALGHSPPVKDPGEPVPQAS